MELLLLWPAFGCCFPRLFASSGGSSFCDKISLFADAASINGVIVSITSDNALIVKYETVILIIYFFIIIELVCCSGHQRDSANVSLLV